jgi:hypothetical protein
LGVIDFYRLLPGTTLYTEQGIIYKVLSVYRESNTAICNYTDGSFRVIGPVSKDIIETLRRKPSPKIREEIQECNESNVG